MQEADNETKEKIIYSTLALISEKGISKTGVEEIAYNAGVSRVTVYRYFPNKKDLVLKAFLRIEQIFQEALNELTRNPQADIESILDQIGQGLSVLPQGDVFKRTDELKRLYPDSYNSIQQIRVSTLNAIFDHIFSLAESQGRLRPGLDRSFVQAIYWELIVNIFDNPRFQKFKLSGFELYKKMTDILNYGILKS